MTDAAYSFSLSDRPSEVNVTMPLNENAIRMIDALECEKAVLLRALGHH
jgi:hypothetical protein